MVLNGAPGPTPTIPHTIFGQAIVSCRLTDLMEMKTVWHPIGR